MSSYYWSNKLFNLSMQCLITLLYLILTWSGRPIITGLKISIKVKIYYQ